MDENHENTHETASMFETWMQNSTKTWSALTQPWPFFANDDTQNQGQKQKARMSQEGAFKIWKAFSSAMSRPETMEALFKGVSTTPDLFLKMITGGWDNANLLMKEWQNQWQNLGKYSGTYNFQNPEKEALNTWNDLYDNAFRKLLNMPQLGLNRFHQEKINRTIDTFNKLQAAMAEFIHLLYKPVEKSNASMQEKLAEMADKGELPDDAKSYYNVWIKTLEGHYMTLFKSPEYLKSLGKTMSAMDDYKSARQGVIDDTLETLSIPTSRDMEEIYKELYTLKKKIKRLEKMLGKQAAETH